MPQTGPKTPKGRERSSQNARKHGLTSTSMFVLDNETPAEWESLLQTWIDKLRPADDAELNIVTDIAHSQWRLRRCRTYETEIVNEQLKRSPSSGAAFKTLADDSRALELIHRYETRHRRAVERGLATLEKLRAMAADSSRPSVIQVMWVDPPEKPEIPPAEPVQPVHSQYPKPPNRVLPNEMPERGDLPVDPPRAA